ncbi:MAG: hypothetical protein LBT51_10045 [Fusobacteriaceae bacterium]|jgi:hypothetical protein|nr:hypothetical protein [Fusobacteriaceae bacterium]
MELFIVSSEMMENNNIMMMKFDDGIVKNNNKENRGIRLKCFEYFIGIIEEFKNNQISCDLKDWLSIKKKFILVYNADKNSYTESREYQETHIIF